VRSKGYAGLGAGIVPLAWLNTVSVPVLRTTIV
jgi:hypothetical protein